jgi:amino acid permease
MNKDTDYSKYYKPCGFKNAMKGFSMVVVGMGFHFNYFPVYNNLHEQTFENASSASFKALLMSSTIYLTVGLLGIFSFGKNLQESVLYNVGTETGHKESYLCLILYALVLACHLPFIFFVGKEALLLIIDEMMH